MQVLLVSNTCVCHALPAEYEVDFINNFTKLTSVGTTFNNEAYLTPEQTLQLKF